MPEPLRERREDYPHFLAIAARWMDNDLCGRVNNVVYYSFFDTVVNRYLINAGGLDIHASPVIGLAVETMCRFHRDSAPGAGACDDSRSPCPTLDTTHRRLTRLSI